MMLLCSDMGDGVFALKSLGLFEPCRHRHASAYIRSLVDERDDSTLPPASTAADDDANDNCDGRRLLSYIP
jgi:hypothetical protein